MSASSYSTLLAAGRACTNALGQIDLMLKPGPAVTQPLCFAFSPGSDCACNCARDLCVSFAGVRCSQLFPASPSAAEVVGRSVTWLYSTRTGSGVLAVLVAGPCDAKPLISRALRQRSTGYLTAVDDLCVCLNATSLLLLSVSRKSHACGSAGFVPAILHGAIRTILPGLHCSPVIVFERCCA